MNALDIVQLTLSLYFSTILISETLFRYTKYKYGDLVVKFIFNEVFKRSLSSYLLNFIPIYNIFYSYTFLKDSKAAYLFLKA